MHPCKRIKRWKVRHLARHCKTSACMSVASGAPSQQASSNGCRNCCKDEGGKVAFASTTPQVGVGDPRVNSWFQPNDWNPGDRENVIMDGCWERACGAAVCGDLPNPTSDNSAEHHARDGDLDYAVVAVGGTHKTCRDHCPFGWEEVGDQGCKEANKRVHW